MHIKHNKHTNLQNNLCLKAQPVQVAHLGRLAKVDREANLEQLGKLAIVERPALQVQQAQGVREESLALQGPKERLVGLAPPARPGPEGNPVQGERTDDRVLPEHLELQVGGKVLVIIKRKILNLQMLYTNIVHI